MTDYSVKLTSNRSTNIQDNGKVYVDKGTDYWKALSAFDKDKNGLTNSELMQAFDYFKNKEQQIALFGEKGDRVITSQDVEEIIKTDTKFETIRKAYNDDSKVLELMKGILIYLSTFAKKVNSKVIQYNSFHIEDNSSPERFQHHGRRYTSYTESELKEYNGTLYRAYKNEKGDLYATSADGKQICKDREVVKNIHGLMSKKVKDEDSIISKTRYYKDRVIYKYKNGKLKQVGMEPLPAYIRGKMVGTWVKE